MFSGRMTAGFRSPALQWFVQQIVEELVIAQVLVRRSSGAFELRHVDDRDVAADKLETAGPNDALAIAQFTQVGAFRPLKSAPSLQRGWRILARTELELELALGRLY